MRYEMEQTGTTQNGWQEEWADWWQGYWSDAPTPRPTVTTVTLVPRPEQQPEFAFASRGEQ